MLDFIPNKILRVFVRQAVLLFIAFALAKYSISYILLKPDIFTHLYSITSVLASSAMTAFGFILVLLGILATITNKTIIKNMGESGHFRVLLGRCILTSLGFLVCFVLSLILIGAKDINEMMNILFLIVFAFIWSLLMALGIGNWIYKIFSNI